MVTSEEAEGVPLADGRRPTEAQAARLLPFLVSLKDKEKGRPPPRSSSPELFCLGKTSRCDTLQSRLNGRFQPKRHLLRPPMRSENPACRSRRPAGDWRTRSLRCPSPWGLEGQRKAQVCRGGRGGCRARARFHPPRSNVVSPPETRSR